MTLVLKRYLTLLIYSAPIQLLFGPLTLTVMQPVLGAPVHCLDPAVTYNDTNPNVTDC